MKLSGKQKSVVLCVLLLGMGVALTVIAVPLYYLFCEKFGIPTPKIQVGERAAVATPVPSGAVGREVTVRFTANVGGGAPLTFYPLSYSMKVRLGEPVLTAYVAKNLAPKALDGVAVHMLYGMGGPSGVDMSQYVDLQQCFCFELQHYPGSTEVRLPLSFTLRPDLPAGIHTVTFSYTLFEALPNDPRLKQHAATALPQRVENVAAGRVTP